MKLSALFAIVTCCGTTVSALAAPATYHRFIGTPRVEESGAIAATRDGGSIIASTRRDVAGAPRNIVLTKLSYTGATQWQREIVRPDDEVPLSIVQTFDGGYALVADVPNAGAGLGLGILRLNAAGGFVWGRIYFGNTAGPDPHGAKIIEVGAANNLVIASRSFFNNGQIPSIIQVTAAGAPVWAWGYIDSRFTAGQNGGFMDIRPFRDPMGGGGSGFLACGWTQAALTAPREPLVVYVNGGGINTVSNVYGAGSNRIFNGMETFPAGDVALTSVDASPDSLYVSLTPALAVGPVVQLGRFRAANESIFTVPPGGVIIGGNDGTNGGNGSLARVDLASATFARFSYGGPVADRVDQIAPANDGVFVAGTINSFTHGASDVWAFRSNVNLRTGCIEGPLVMPVAVLPPSIMPVPFGRTSLQFTQWQPQVVSITHLNTIICLNCPADFNGDGAVDFFDYLDFVDALSLGLPSADFNGDGSVDFFDYLDFVDAFSLGC